MGDYYTPQKRGGVIASKIEHQDSVGLIFAIELLNSGSKYAEFDDNEKPWAIVPEGNDDLEVLFKENRIFIQVKSSEISNRNELEDIFNNFKKNKEKLINSKLSIKPHFILYALKGINRKLKDFEVKLKELTNGINIYEEKELMDRKISLLNQYNINVDYCDLLDELEIRTQSLLKDSDELFPIFAHKLRQCYSIRDFGDKLLIQLYKELIEMFAEGRRTRKAIKRKDFLYKIHSIININENYLDDLSFQIGYSKTSIGYEKINSNIINDLYKQVKRARWDIAKEWWKEYWVVGATNLFFGNWEKCQSCGHPLMANFGGLGGLACPDCGYQPYATLFLGCSCGSYKKIKEQPALTTEEFWEAVREYFEENSKICDKCNKNILDEYWKYRLMLLPVPYPIKEMIRNLKKKIPKKDLIIRTIILLLIVYVIIFKVV